jgi:hypothetical protein
MDRDLARHLVRIGIALCTRKIVLSVIGKDPALNRSTEPITLVAVGWLVVRAP